MDRFVSFLDEISIGYKEYTPEDWVNMDEKFDKLTGEWYKKYENEFSFKEEMKIQGYKVKYGYYRAFSEGKSTLEDIWESIDVKGMREEIDSAAKDVKQVVEEFVESVDMNQVQKDMEAIGEEIQKAAEEVVETIDSLATEWEK